MIVASHEGHIKENTENGGKFCIFIEKAWEALRFHREAFQRIRMLPNMRDMKEVEISGRRS
jgi:hypothetical protein